MWGFNKKITNYYCKLFRNVSELFETLVHTLTYILKPSVTLAYRDLVSEDSTYEKSRFWLYIMENIDFKYIEIIQNLNLNYNIKK
jgi:hypothetical protein